MKPAMGGTSEILDRIPAAAPIKRAVGWRRRREAAHVVRTVWSHVGRGGRVLDLGCGRGYVGALLESGGIRCAVGCDVVAGNEALQRFCTFDGWALPFRDDAFEATILAFILHHTPDPTSLLREAARVTRRRLVILEDTPRSPVDWAYAAFHVWSFNGVKDISWRGRVLSAADWLAVFPRLGLRVLASGEIPRRERWPPVARSLFVVEPRSTS